MGKILTEISRILIGTLFVVSGLIKSNDILGFVYKLEEYFEPGALNMEAFTPYALEIAIFVVIGEILLGVAMLIGAKPKLTTVLTLIMMLFFTWLTYYTSTCDPTSTVQVENAQGVMEEIPVQCVLECGCFGNAIPLEPYESFIKDIVILVLFIPFVVAAFRNKIKLNTREENMYVVPASIVLMALFCYLVIDWNFPILFLAICLLVAAILSRKIANAKTKEWIIAAGIVLVCGFFQYWTIAHLPLKDYRPYAIGQDIRENMKSAEELGKEAPVYANEYTFKNVNTGQDTIILSTDYLNLYKEEWFKNTYENVSWEGETVKLKDGYEPLIQDLAPMTYDGDEMLSTLLDNTGSTLLFISKDLNAVSEKHVEGLADLANTAQANGYAFYGLVSADYDTAENFKHTHQLPFEFLETDFIELKIIIRSNPGLVLLHDGVVIDKWAWRDFPGYDNLPSQ